MSDAVPSGDTRTDRRPTTSKVVSAVGIFGFGLLVVGLGYLGGYFLAGRFGLAFFDGFVVVLAAELAVVAALLSSDYRLVRRSDEGADRDARGVDRIDTVADRDAVPVGRDRRTDLEVVVPPLVQQLVETEGERIVTVNDTRYRIQRLPADDPGVDDVDER